MKKDLVASDSGLITDIRNEVSKLCLVFQIVQEVQPEHALNSQHQLATGGSGLCNTDTLMRFILLIRKKDYTFQPSV